MADEKWTAFTNGGNIQAGDIVVGLRGGVNYQFNAPLYGQSVIDVTETSYAMVANTIYVPDNVGLVTLTLPTTAPFGSIISVVGYGPGGWKIAQNASGQIIVSPQNTSLGFAGSISSTDQFDTLTLMCIVADNVWTAFGAPQSQGLTFV